MLPYFTPNAHWEPSLENESPESDEIAAALLLELRAGFHSRQVEFRNISQEQEWQISGAQQAQLV